MFFLQDELKKFKRKSVNTYYNKALDLVKDNNISEAVEVIEKSFENITEDVEILNLMGLCQYVLCNFDQASLYWNKSLLTSNIDNRAKDYVEYLNSDKFKNFIDYYNLSISYIDKLKYENAVELLLQINKTNEDLIEPYGLIGNCYYSLGEHDLAEKYLNEALRRDIANPKYLKYLNKISPDDSIDKKNKNINYKVLFGSSALFILLILVGFAWKYNKDVKAFNLELEKTKSEYNELKEEIEKQKNNDKVAKLEEDEKEEILDKKEDEIVEELSYSGTDFEILQNAMKDFGDANYKQAINKLKYLIDLSNNDDIISESIYYTALSLEREKIHDEAEEYYKSYIDKYRDRTYYDDSLYNYGLMLHERGDIEGSKEILNRLKEEEGDSIFMNSKVRSILDS